MGGMEATPTLFISLMASTARLTGFLAQFNPLHRSREPCRSSPPALVHWVWSVGAGRGKRWRSLANRTTSPSDFGETAARRSFCLLVRCPLSAQSGHGARGAATASVCCLYGPQSNLLPELGNVDWYAVLCVRL